MCIESGGDRDVRWGVISGRCGASQRSLAPPTFGPSVITTQIRLAMHRIQTVFEKNGGAHDAVPRLVDVRGGGGVA